MSNYIAAFIMFFLVGCKASEGKEVTNSLVAHILRIEKNLFKKQVKELENKKSKSKLYRVELSREMRKEELAYLAQAGEIDIHKVPSIQKVFGGHLNLKKSKFFMLDVDDDTKRVVAWVGIEGNQLLILFDTLIVR